MKVTECTGKASVENLLTQCPTAPTRVHRGGSSDKFTHFLNPCEIFNENTTSPESFQKVNANSLKVSIVSGIPNTKSAKLISRWGAYRWCIWLLGVPQPEFFLLGNGVHSSDNLLTGVPPSRYFYPHWGSETRCLEMVKI